MPLRVADRRAAHRADVAALWRIVDAHTFDAFDVAVYHVSDGVSRELGDDVAAQPVGIIVATFHVGRHHDAETLAKIK